MSDILSVMVCLICNTLLSYIHFIPDRTLFMVMSSRSRLHTKPSVRHSELGILPEQKLKQPSKAQQKRVFSEPLVLAERSAGFSAEHTFRDAASMYVYLGGEERFLSAVLPALGDVALSRINLALVCQVAGYLYPAASPATINRQVFTPVSAVLRCAAEAGWCPEPALRRPKQHRSPARWITKAEADRLIECAAPHLKPLLVFLLYTGARIGEALRLDWKDVDLDRRHVDFIETKNGTSRGVPLHGRVVEALKNLSARKGRVFRDHLGRPYTLPVGRDARDTSSGSRIKSAFSTAIKKAGLEGFRVHDCRHTWATWHYRANRDLGALQRLGGWKSTQMVLRYAHTNVEDLAVTVDRI